MEVTPKTLRDAEFREVKRGGGYIHEDVDDFIEEVAKGVEVLQERLRQALERAQRAEASAAEASTTDDALRRTLVLAQRTADAAVAEAREQATRIIDEAGRQAHALLSESEERARRAHEEAVGATQAELAALEASRARAQAEVDTLQRWAADERSMIVAGLREAAAAVERAGAHSPAPASAPIEVPPAPPRAIEADTGQRAPRPVEPAGQALHDGGEPGSHDPGPPTEVWHPGQALAQAPADDEELGEDDQRALDEFFDDASYTDDSRGLGGRLRRRR